MSSSRGELNGKRETQLLNAAHYCPEQTATRSNSTPLQCHPWFCDRTLHEHQQQDKGQRHDRCKPENVEVRQRGCLLVTQFEQRLQSHLLGGGRIAGQAVVELLPRWAYSRTIGLSGSRLSLIRGMKLLATDFERLG